MATFLYWFGVLHVAAYALAGFIFASALFVDWVVRRFKLKADLFKAAHIMFKARADAKNPRIGA